MNKKKILLAIVLFALGFVGILSVLTMDIPIPPEVESMLSGKFSETQIKLITLINPTLFLLFAVLLGTVLYKKVNLTVPIIEKIVGIETKSIKIATIVQYGIIGGILAGTLISLLSFLFHPILPGEFKEIGESLKPSIAARFLYGGITEEILMRFGLMTFFVWLVLKLSKSVKPYIYWIGILLAAIIFAIGHFPIAFQAVENPTNSLLFYILLGNSIGGIVFGWLYWKKGLESAFIAHIFAHVSMLLFETILK